MDGRVSNREDSEIIQEALTRFAEAETYYSEIRRQALEDLKFRSGDQWPEHVRRERELDDRPCITANHLPQYERQITNEFRMNKMGLRVSPVDDKGDVETAKVIQGLFRAIEYNSTAQAAYTTALKSAANIGFGFIRVVTEYESPYTFDQVIKIKRVRNPFSVLLDPAHENIDGSDAKWGFIEELMPKPEFKEKWPEANACNATAFSTASEGYNSWITQDAVRIAQYFVIEYDTRTLVLTSEGPLLKAQAEQLGLEWTQTRKARIPIVAWYKLTSTDVLERTVIPGSYIPIVPVYGDELDVDGKVIYEGVIRHAKDPQRMLNYWISAETESIALAPKSPLIAAEGQIEGHERDWKDINKRPKPYVQYKPKTLAGKLLPAPYRLNSEAQIAAITQARMGAIDNLKSATGIYNPSLGATSSEQTGRAINARTQQSQLSNSHFVDNLSYSYTHLGRIIIGMVPTIYDTQRILRIIGADGKEQKVGINGMAVGEQEFTIDFATGAYDVVVDSGPSFLTRRREAVDALMMWNQNFPQLSQLGGDLIASSMDFPHAQELAKRLKTMLPPELQDDQDPNQVVVQLQQAMQENEQLKQQLQAITELQLKIQSEMQMNTQDNQTKLAVAQINARKVESSGLQGS